MVKLPGGELSYGQEKLLEEGSKRHAYIELSILLWPDFYICLFLKNVLFSGSKMF